MGICKVLIKMKRKSENQANYNKYTHTGLGFFFICCVFGCNFFKEPEKKKSLCILLLQMVSVQNEGLCLHPLK